MILFQHFYFIRNLNSNYYSDGCDTEEDNENLPLYSIEENTNQNNSNDDILENQNMEVDNQSSKYKFFI